MRSIREILRDSKGTSAVEYGLLCGILCVAMIAGFQNVSGGLNATLARISNVFTP